jgi:hypothetical protein
VAEASKPNSSSPFVPTFVETNTQLFEGLAVVNEWASFVNRRLEEDRALLQRIEQCNTIQEVHQVYSRFFQTAFEHYSSGFVRMLDLTRAVPEMRESETEPPKSSVETRH